MSSETVIGLMEAEIEREGREKVKETIKRVAWFDKTAKLWVCK